MKHTFVSRDYVVDSNLSIKVLILGQILIISISNFDVVKEDVLEKMTVRGTILGILVIFTTVS